MSSRLEVIASTGGSDLAEVFVAREKGRPERMLEFVDGLDPRHPREEKWIVNVSTQFGCPACCLFCDAGGSYRGDVPAGLMIEQVERVLERHPAALREQCRKLKVHFSRMGEPALNAEVPQALERLRDLIPGPGLWACAATIAPEGSRNWFRRVLAVKERFYHGRFQLQFSVNSTDAACRRRLMPYPHESMEHVASIGRGFWQPGDRKVVLNFALAKGVPVEPRALGDLFDPAAFMVKLTPLNPTARGMEQGLESLLAPRDSQAAAELADALCQRGFEVVLSVGDTREDQIGSNCGQAVRRLHDSLRQSEALVPAT